MSSLSAVLYLLKEEDMSEDESAELIQQLSAKFRNTELLLENLLDWSRLHIRGIEIVKSETNIEELVKKKLELFADPLSEKDISIETNIEADKPVFVDVNITRFILRNLISNAIKFSNRGGKITVTLKAESDGLRGSIIDEGIGIPDDQIPLLFSYDIKSTYGTENERGTGLGLAMCKEYAEKHDGSIEVQSTEGKGSVFTFCLKS
jgi:signal transduction histidine kinase